jgi:ATP-dependent Lon protease
MKKFFEVKFNGLQQEEYDEDAEFIPIISDEEEDENQKVNIPDVLPVLPLRNTVLFPGVVIPITVGREKSL